MQPDQPNFLTTLIPIAIVVLVLLFRMRGQNGMMAERPLKLKYFWIRPAIYIVAAVAVVLVAPPSLDQLAWLALAALLGAAGGWQWGRTMAIHVHPENGTLMVKGSQAAMLVIIGLIVVRVGLRQGLEMEAAAWHLSTIFIADVFIVFAAMLFAVRGLEMMMRARRVMGAARPPQVPGS